MFCLAPQGPYTRTSNTPSTCSEPLKAVAATVILSEGRGGFGFRAVGGLVKDDSFQADNMGGFDQNHGP